MTDTTELTLVADGQTYSLSIVPLFDSPAVIAAREKVLQGVSLDELLNGLGRSEALLNLAYHGVRSSGPISKRVNTLRFSVLQVYADAKGLMSVIDIQGEQLLDNLVESIGWLYRGQEEATMDFLGNCATAAHAMANSASELATRFENLASEADATVGDVLVEQGQRILDVDRIQAERSALKAQNVANKTLVDGLKVEVEDVNKAYEEAAEAAERAEGRAFSVAITGAIFGGLGQGLGAAASVVAGSRAGVSPAPFGPTPIPTQTSTPTPTPTPTPTATPSPAAADTAAADAAAAETASKLLDELADQLAAVGAKTSLTKADAVDDAPAADAAGKPEANAAPAAKPGPKAAPPAKTSLTTAEETALTKAHPPVTVTSTQLAQAVLAGGGAALNKMGDALEKTAASYADIAQGHMSDKREAFRMLRQLKEQQRNALAAIASFAIQMESLETVEAFQKSVIDSLRQAEAALRQVAVILLQQRVFWRNMAVSFEALASNNTQMKIAKNVKYESDPAKRIAAYHAVPFKTGLLGYLASWAAMRSIAQEYRDRLAVQEKLAITNYARTLSVEESMKEVRVLAKALLDVTLPAYSRTEEQVRALEQGERA